MTFRQGLGAISSCSPKAMNGQAGERTVTGIQILRIPMCEVGREASNLRLFEPHLAQQRERSLGID